MYHKAYLLGQELEFRYNSTEKKILSIFQKADRHDLYAYWYEDFLNRSKYDKRFKKLQKNEIMLLKRKYSENSTF